MNSHYERRGPAHDMCANRGARNHQSATTDKMRHLRNFWFRAAPFSRLQPGFFIIGAQKCGTTSLANWLAQHPAICPPRTKELKYFTQEEEFAKGDRWYFSNFPPRFLKRSANASSFEATPCLFHPLAPERVLNTLGQIKKIILLRDPAERAISHYKHNLRNGREKRGIEEAIYTELDDLGHGKLAGGKSPAAAYRFGDTSYAAKGVYIHQIDKWLQHHALETFLILRSEDMFEDPRTAILTCLDFIDLPRPGGDHILTDAKNVNSLQTDVPQELRDRLADFYRAPNRELAARFGISW